ncbi:acetylcholinesterase-like [Ptychodera flava]|uniref:acetylcholinesterase-like n=1 Tax=Ptychodera flava TaxID=63121 RepID=UPI003969E0FE
MRSAQITWCMAILGCVTALDPTVEIKSGKLVGKSVDFSHKDVDVTRTLHVFKGIPYAEPPVGDLRFRPPQSKAPWEGVHDATEFGAIASSPQTSLWTSEGLRAKTVWLIHIVKEYDYIWGDLLPVMVWIYGGAFYVGAGSEHFYDGTALAAIGDVIIVTFNYRIGAFGFFVTGDEHATGNYGFLDQIEALKWVQENIAAFGGDASRVTVFGESAGSMSAEFLMLSPLADGLFHRAIMQSGTSTMATYTGTDAALHNRIAHALGEVLGCEKGNSEELMKCLRTVPAEKFKEPSDPHTGMIAGLVEEVEGVPFIPYVDGHFLIGKPEDLIPAKNFSKGKVDLLIGTMADEGTVVLLLLKEDMANESDVFMSKAEYDEMFQMFLYGPLKHSPAAVDAIKLMYVDWANADSDEANYAESFSQMQGDQLFVCPSVMSARAYSQAGANVYLYHMTHSPANSVFESKWMKAAHFEDVPSYSDSHFHPGEKSEMPEEEAAMSLKIMKYWTNFAKTGNPNLSCTDAENSDEDWPPFKVPGLAYKEISVGMETKRGLKATECALWNDFIPKLLKHTDADSICHSADDTVEKYTEEGNRPE